MIKHTLFVLTISAVICANASADDWPTYNHDQTRSGMTTENIATPLHEQWRFEAPHPPEPAWPAPAPADIWQRLPKLNPRVTYDRAYHAVISDGVLAFGSSADNTVYALDATSGEYRWSHRTGGPVRLAPVINGGKVYAGSDDGSMYCLDLYKGTRLWQYTPRFEEHMLPGNERMISRFPVRSGALVKDGILYFSAGLFPKEGVGLYALDASSGRPVWTSAPENLSPQGYMLASRDNLYIPTGRTLPVAASITNGDIIGGFKASHGNGGTYALVTDNTLISGPGRNLVAMNTDSRETLLTFAGTRMIVSGGTFYLVTDTELIAYDRTALSENRAKRRTLSQTRKVLADSVKTLKSTDGATANIAALEREITGLNRTIKSLEQSEHLWKASITERHSMILAGNTLFLGGKNTVTAYDSKTGRKTWSSGVDGTAYGMAAANGHLYVSTSNGVIHCFATSPTKTAIRTCPKKSNPYADAKNQRHYRDAAQNITRRLASNKGYCLVLDCVDGGLINELARSTDFSIVGIARDEATVSDIREKLAAAGLYGVRASIHKMNPDSLAFGDYLFNLIVSEKCVLEGSPSSTPEELFRVLRPEGGLAMIGGEKARDSRMKSWIAGSDNNNWTTEKHNGTWAVAQRGVLPGSGEWTHQYAEPGNSASSGDTFVRDPMRLQWFGRPGPRYINDRHHRPMAPLYKNGRVFVIGNNHLFASDAYNGAILWENAVPDMRRVGVNRDCGHAVVSDRALYVAVKDECLGFDVESGEIIRRFSVPQKGTETLHWGYLATVGETVIGTTVKPSAPRTTLSYQTILDGTYFDSKPVVGADRLFSINASDGSVKWTYDSIGAMFNSTVATDGNYVYFVESGAPGVADDTDGRILLTDAFKKGASFVVCLDINTGKTVWKKPFIPPYEHTLYLAVKGSKVLVIGSFNKPEGLQYRLYTYDKLSGKPVWDSQYTYGTTLNGDHGEQDQHPVIIGDRIYSRPFDFSLTTGEQGQFNLVRGGHGCGTISGSAAYLFGRGGNPRMYDITRNGAENIAMSMVNRPGCFINIIPAGGLVLIPESSSGCTCGYPMQMSVAFAPAH